MLGIRTPKKNINDDDRRESPKSTENDNQKTEESSVRRSIGEWEMGKAGALPKFLSSTTQAGPLKPKSKPSVSQDVKRGASTEVPADKIKETHTSTRDRTAEARSCLVKAKTNLGDARNLRGDIKVEVTRMLERLYQLVKEAEAERKESKEENNTEKTVKNIIPVQDKKIEEEYIITQIEENRKILLENKKTMEEIKEELQKNRLNTDKTTYATVTATPASLRQPARPALHSIVVTSKDDQDSGEEVLQKIREAVDAKEGWIKVERIRKARDRKIIMGCSTKEDRKKVKEKIEKSGKHLKVEEMENKDPLLTLKDVLVINSDGDVLRAIRKQNSEIFSGLSEVEDRMQIKYKRKARNPHANHIVMSVAPTVWKRALESGTVRIDLQRIRVADQSPLVQCTRCLDYGHSKRFCKEPADACSHCGEPHLRGECTNRLAGVKPACRNCVRAKYEDVEHNAFSDACPIRKKWDAIARASIAYC